MNVAKDLGIVGLFPLLEKESLQRGNYVNFVLLLVADEISDGRSQNSGIISRPIPRFSQILLVASSRSSPTSKSEKGSVL